MRVASVGNTEKSAHRLDAELIPMRINELVRLPRFALELMRRHGVRVQLRTQMFALIQEKLVTP